jgi:hypothetical protein
MRIQYVAADRVALGFSLKDHRKNRESHLSQRNGRTKIIASVNFSKIPLRLD